MENENVEGKHTGGEPTSAESEDCPKVNKASVDFLREQHAVVLRGLQVEIETLRETCADLQFQLVFNGLKRSSSSTSSSSNEEESSSSLKAELSETRRACYDLRSTIEALEHRNHQQEERYQEDIGARNLIVARLRKEVQEKKNTISNLVKLLRVRPDRCHAGVNLNRDEILRRAEAQIGSTEPGPLLTVFSPKVGRSSSLSSQSSSSSPVSRPKSTVTTMSDLGKQLMEKYCGGGTAGRSGGAASRLNTAFSANASGQQQTGQNGNPAPRSRPDSLGGPLMPDVDVDAQMHAAPVSILEPWSPHQSNGRN